MTLRLPQRLAVAATLALCALAVRADSPLYETGPGQDSSFVRFLNATGESIEVVAAKGGYRIELTTAGAARVSKFHPATAGTKLLATVRIGARSLPVEVVAKPGEYITATVVAADKAGARTHLIRELPSDYNAARASISLSNADPACVDAALTGGAASVAIFEGVKPFDIKRRLVNPVRVAAQVSCAGKPLAEALDFGQLQPGERYSAFIIPAAGGRTAFVVRDATL